MNYLLDTNLVLIYLRSNQLTQRINQDLNIFSSENRLVISAVTVGELKSISKRNKWGRRRIQHLITTLKNFIITDIKMTPILEKYAEIDAYSQGKLEDYEVNFSARNMGKNDLWIAATASSLDIELITTDKDFEHLKDTFLKLKVIKLEDYR